MTLKNVSFIASVGKTVVLVSGTIDETATILKLIDLLYNVDSGTVSIDGQNIRNVTISSSYYSISNLTAALTTLQSSRKDLCCVSQSCDFNDTLVNNIRFANLSATNQEVYKAYKAASIHDKIKSFAGGYNTIVDDYGV